MVLLSPTEDVRRTVFGVPCMLLLYFQHISKYSVQRAQMISDRALEALRDK